SFLPSVDAVAHFAGFVAGLALGPLLFRDAMVQRPAAEPEPTLEQLGPISRPSMSVSFQEPMDFPKGTTVYRAPRRLVAILPDWTLIADDGAGGAMFDTAEDYRDKTRDDGDWIWVKEF